MPIERVLVTGSSGTVGTALMSELLDKGYSVYGADLMPNPWSNPINDRTQLVDLRNFDEVSELPTDIDLVIHLAAHARVHESVKDPQRMMENLTMTFNVLEYVRRTDVPHFLFASSREVYGDSDGIISSERETNIDRAKSPYTASKIGGESMVQAYSECYGLSYCITRFSNVYGRYDDSDRVIPLFIERSSRGKPLTVFGAEKILDFTYIDDCIDGLVGMLNEFHKVSGSTLNLSSGQGTSLIELAREINTQTPSDSDIRIESSRSGEVQKYVGDVSRAERLTGYNPQYSLKSGLKLTTEWYLDRPAVLDRIANHS